MDLDQFTLEPFVTDEPAGRRPQRSRRPQNTRRRGRRSGNAALIQAVICVAALLLLLGLELDTLSVTPRMYLRVKNNIRHLNFETCSDLAQAALLMGSSEEIRNLIEQNDKNEDS